MAAFLTSPTGSPLSHSSNLLHYRALFQVLTYANVKEQSAEHMVRDAMTGGVVVPFTVQSTLETEGGPMQAASSTAASSTAASSALLSPTSLAEHHGAARSCVILLPSSKCVAVLASLLADGFFSFAPLASTAEEVREATYQHRSECEARDLFTLIALLFPDCVVEEALPRTLLAMRSGEATAAPTQTVSRVDSERYSPPTASMSSPSLPTQTVPAGGARSWKTPPAQRVHTRAADSTDAAAPQCTSPCLPDVFVDSDDRRSPAPLSRLQSPPARSMASESMLDAFVGAAPESTGISAAALASSVVPEVDAVPLSLDALQVLLDCRRSLATVLLSSINAMLHDVQYRELARSKPAQAAKTAPQPSCEGAVLQFSNEVLLTAKMMLLCMMSASEVWRRRQWRGTPSTWLRDSQVSPSSSQSALAKLAPQSHTSSPHRTLFRLLESDVAAVTQFIRVPVEEWTWWKEKDALGQWYDHLLDQLLQSTELAGVRLDTLLCEAKTFAVERGREVSRTPTLLLHRPSDGQPAVEMNLSSIGHLNCAVPLPAMPLQPGELQLFLFPSTRRKTRTRFIAIPRGHELLFDSSASPTADFLQSCVAASHPVVAAGSARHGSASPSDPLFRFPFDHLTAKEQGLVDAFLHDEQNLSAFVDKNPVTLARVTAWLKGVWPPPQLVATLNTAVPLTPTQMASTATDTAASLAAEVEESLLFQRPFSGAIGRYVREAVTLKGLEQPVAERWIRHICDNTDAGTAATPHRAIFAALVKFAVLHNRWTLDPEVEELQRRRFS